MDGMRASPYRVVTARDPSGDHLAPFLNLDVVCCVPLFDTFIMFS
jgi:hypothetical protein